MRASSASLVGLGDLLCRSDLSEMYSRELSNFISRLTKSKKPRQLRKACFVFLAYFRAQQDVKAAVKSLTSPGSENHHFFRLVRDAHEGNVEKMMKILLELQENHSAVVGDVVDAHAAGLVLHHQRSMIEHMQHRGELMDLDAEELLACVNKKLKQLYLEPLSSKDMHSHHKIRVSRIAPNHEEEESSRETPVEAIPVDNMVAVDVADRNSNLAPDQAPKNRHKRATSVALEFVPLSIRSRRSRT